MNVQQINEQLFCDNSKFDGEILTISQLAEMLGMNYNTLYSKLRKERINNECK